MNNNKITCHSMSRFSILIFFIVLAIRGYAQNGTIVLNSQVPETKVTVVANQAVVLKPGFRAVGSSGEFNAKIGTKNAIFPLIPVAEGSTVSVNPSSTQNYIQTKTFLLPTDNSPAITSIQYFDGLGRPSQTVQVGMTPKGADLVSMTEYDGFGRESLKWMPTNIEGNFGKFVDVSSMKSTAKSRYNDQNPFIETGYEPSPLNRVSAQWGAGQDWRDASRANRIDYQTNIANDVVLYQMDGENLKNARYYDASQLYVTKSTDEENHEVYEFKDKQGQVILKRAMAEDGPHNTYYVYDDFGNLRYVLSPEASDRMMTQKTYIQNWCNTPDNPLDQYAYIYKYDYRNRCIGKKLPGAKWINMVYDKADRLVLSQDGNQRVANTCAMTKYDALGRVIQTGILSNINDSLQSAYAFYQNRIVTESFDSNSGYTSTTELPSGASFAVQIQNFYDTYDFLNLSAFSAYKSNLTYLVQSGYDAKYSYTINSKDYSGKGLLTGTAVPLLDNSGILLTANYYDDKGRMVQALSNNHLGGYDKEYFKYNFTGQPLKKQHLHTAPLSASVTYPVSIKEVFDYVYDHAGRLQTTNHTINDKTTFALSSLSYDELGRLQTKRIHGGIDSTQYTYNVRGWLKSIQSQGFSETLYYQDQSGHGNSPQYNGNISASQWSPDYYYNDDTYQRYYNYSYDKLNRLLSAKFNTIGAFDESFGYDKNGNILNLKRNGEVMYIDEWGDYYSYIDCIDDLEFTPNGNQLKKTVDRITNDDQFIDLQYDFKDKDDSNYPVEYKYDANGNMRADLNKNIAWIRYNQLNLPQKVQFGNGNANEYLYDASGMKRRAMYYTSVSPIQIPLDAVDVSNSNVTMSSKTDYCGNYIYEKGALKTILTPEGAVDVTWDSGSPKYFIYKYSAKDHLGNTRAQYITQSHVNPASKSFFCMQRTDYYPSGLEFTRPDVGSNAARYTPYLYNSKEMDRMNGLSMMDYGARWRYSDLPIWSSVDPLAEKHYYSSPYAYCGNNPVNRIDPDGRDWFVNNRDGNLIFLKGVSKLTSEMSKQYGLGSVKNYERLGKDNMFGNKVSSGRFDDVLDQKFVTFEGSSSSEKFMNAHGFKQAERVRIEEKKVTTVGDSPNGKPDVKSTYSLKQIGETAITYVKPEVLNVKSQIKQTTVGDQHVNFNEIETTTYSLTKAIGQNNSSTSHYNDQRNSDNVNTILNIVSNIIDIIIP